MDILITLYLFGFLLTAVLCAVDLEVNNHKFTWQKFAMLLIFSLLSWFGMYAPLTELFNKLKSR